jgi:hypothetical protein
MSPKRFIGRRWVQVSHSTAAWVDTSLGEYNFGPTNAFGIVKDPTAALDVWQKGSRDKSLSIAPRSQTVTFVVVSKHSIQADTDMSG